MATSTHSGTFEKQSFAEGRFRRAFKGIWNAPPELAGKQMVVKEMKSTYMWEAKSWDTTIRNYDTALELAKKFNSAVNPSRQVSYTDVTRCIVTSRSDSTATPKVNEYVIVEDYLPGDFTKWCNNYGYIRQIATGKHYLLPAFMHWSWAHTRGERMVADLQGVFSDNHYRLTDPAIMSLDGNFGVTDTSVEGIVVFFIVHNCIHALCSKLPTPTLMDFARVIPDKDLKDVQQKVREMGSSTTYREELQLRPEIRSKALAVLRRVGQEN